MTGYIEAFVSANTLAAVLVVCVVTLTTAIFALIRVKKRLQTQLASYKTNVKYNVTVASESKSAVADLDTRKNIAYEPNPAVVNPRNHIAYESSIDTDENISYAVHTQLK